MWWGSISLCNPAVILVASSLSGHELHQCMFWRPCHQGKEGECLKDVLTLCLVVCLSLTFLPFGHTIFSFCLCLSLIFLFLSLSFIISFLSFLSSASSFVFLTPIPFLSSLLSPPSVSFSFSSFLCVSLYCSFNIMSRLYQNSCIISLILHSALAFLCINSLRRASWAPTL